MAGLRLDKMLAHMGLGSRKDIKKLARAGEIVVNGMVVRDTAQKIHPDRDEVVVGGQPVRYREHIYLMMNKPAGYISATEDRSLLTVLELLSDQYACFELFPVGRLDRDTEGLILLTNDGKLAHELLSPKKHVPKTYLVRIDSMVTADQRLALEQGVTLDDGYRTLPAKLEVVQDKSVEVLLTITEGKYHQVKRMFASVGKKVLYLKRLAIGGLWLDENLAPGQYRELTDEELELLRSQK
ncbi:MAG: pseudouridine synthase [Bacillota bacterium]|uniref:pseudouridine synthase n=1 Tax=Desulfurispora thermophila TaxID=265470 RepID=UPI000363C1B2|nr:pseudouridine synthase [Desulfurispora thermophila]